MNALLKKLSQLLRKDNPDEEWVVYPVLQEEVRKQQEDPYADVIEDIGLIRKPGE